MKKITLLSLLVAMVAALSFTSCNSSDGDSYQGPSVEQQQTMVSNLGYMQDGMLVYYNENKLNVKDVTDTIPNTIAYMTSNTSKDQNTGAIIGYYGSASFQFPVNALKNYINDAKLAEKIGEKGMQTLKVNLYPYSAENMTYIANPEDLKLGDITTDNQTYKDVTIKFYVGTYLGGYGTNTTTKKQFFQILMSVGAIYVNGNQTSLLKNYIINNQQYAPSFLFTTAK